ncbi:RNA polymerase sigma factor [Paenarthrobacter sp. NPDC056912]|uniref:RNA polymerase sigma factor n=1 Tax=Paenarthrobacter sp. NPDC056912 TaxID=3345965 RepID=UPI00366F60BA
MLLQREAEFISLHAAQHERVLHYILRRVGELEVARELTADVFRIAWQKSEDEPTTDVAWLFAVARNVIGNEYRGRRRRRELMVKLAEGVRAAAEPAGGDVEAAVAETLGRLRARDREILMLHFWDKLTTAELAASLGCTENSVGVRLHRAKRAFAAAMPADLTAGYPDKDKAGEHSHGQD